MFYNILVFKSIMDASEQKSWGEEKLNLLFFGVRIASLTQIQSAATIPLSRS